MHKLILFFTCLFLSATSFAQFPEQSVSTLKAYEDTLSKLGEQVRSGYTEQERIKANYAFIPKLVAALKTPGSFDYPFNELSSVSIMYPEDRSFRIFTWQLLFGNETYRNFGAIQMNSKELKLFALIDRSDSLGNPIDTILTADSWYGALYYKILETKGKGKKKYYNLFGYDSNDFFSRKKLVDVLHFEDGKPVFGAPIFHFPGDSVQTRFILEYKKDAGVTLNYIPERNVMVFDHLIPRDPLSEGLYFTYIPDGTYEGFELKKGEWYYTSKVFHEAINEFDNPPVPVPKSPDRKDGMINPR